jgi:DNA-binding transcriptional LysR family regulator
MQELAEHGSFLKVGRLRGRAPSSISCRLDRLEDHLNNRLFNRAPTGLFLTAQGTRKLIEGRTLTDAAANFATRDGEDGVLSGYIVISAPSRLGEAVITLAVAQFLKTHPNVSIDLHFTDLIQDLDQDKIDLSVRIGTQAPDHHFIQRFVENRRILTAAPAYLTGFDDIQSVTDLDTHSGLFLGSTLSWKLAKPDTSTHVARPKARLRAVACDVLLTMCKAGLSITLKSSRDVRKDLAARTIVRVLPDWQQADPSDIMIVTPSGKLVSLTIKAFSKMLGDYLKRNLSIP